MNLNYTSLLLASCILLACGQQEVKNQVNEDSVLVDGPDQNPRAQRYLDLMETKKFRFEEILDCDDAVMDTIHTKYKVYDDTLILTDSGTVVEFEFLATCCTSYLGDYEVVDRNLQITYEEVGYRACACECYFRYRMTITEPLDDFEEVVFLMI